MNVNYDPKYVNPIKSAPSGGRQPISVSRNVAEESSLKAYYHVHSQNRLKVQNTSLCLLKNKINVSHAEGTNAHVVFICAVS